MICSIFGPNPRRVTTHSPLARTQQTPGGPAGSTAISPSTTHRSVMLFVVRKLCVKGAVRCAPSGHVRRSMNSARLFPRIARRSAHGMLIPGTVRVTVTTCPSTISRETYSCSNVPI